MKVRTDADDGSCPDTRKSMMGSMVYLNDAPVLFRSSAQKIVSISTMEAKLNVAVMSLQVHYFFEK